MRVQRKTTLEGVVKGLSRKGLAAPAVVGGAADFGIVMALPSSPPIGARCIFKAAAGIYWELIYTKESSEYPWNVIGGPPLFAEVVTNQGITSSTYGNLATVGPEITLPLKGDYMVAIGAGIYDSGPVNTDATMSYAIGASAAADADSIDTNSFSLPSNVSAVIPGGLSRVRKKTGLGAVALVAKYKSSANSGSATATFYNRWMRVDPLRVG